MVGKIEGVGSGRATSSVRRAARTGKAGKAEFSQHLEGPDETEAAAAASAAGAVGAVEGVISVQEIEDALARAAKGKMRASDILDRLESLRIDILNGALSRDKLRQLAHIVNLRRPEVTDPRLGEVLDEIDLRAKVELAKFAGQY